MKLLVTNPTNIRYLTGFTCIDRGDAWLVVDDDKKYLITNSLYIEEARKLSCEVIASQNFVESVEALGMKELAFEENNLTVAEYNRFSIKLVPTQGKIEALRQIKRKDEIDAIRLASTITSQAFQFIKKRIKPGVTEARIAYELEGYLKVKGGDLAFSPIVAFNEHASQPHYANRGNLPLRKNGFVLLDFGAKVNGYCSDMTRMVFLGKPIPAYEVVVRSQKKVFDLLRTGERNGATLDKAAKKIIDDAGYPPYTHSLGHSIGLDVHEAPRLSERKNEKLSPNMVFTVEPGCYVPANYGIRIEDTVLLKKDGIQILTQ